MTSPIRSNAYRPARRAAHERTTRTNQPGTGSGRLVADRRDGGCHVDSLFVQGSAAATGANGRAARGGPGTTASGADAHGRPGACACGHDNARPGRPGHTGRIR